MRFDGLPETINRTQYLLPRMNTDDLLRAIREPAALYDGAVTDRLAERLVADSRGGQDELPLIQHGLSRLWHFASSATSDPDGPAPILDLPAYEKHGPLGRLLSEHADQIADGVAGDAVGQRIVEELFRALTDINADGNAVRRPQPFAVLAAVAGTTEARLQAILDAFRAAGVSFVTPFAPQPIDAGTTIDISHEALIRRWQRIDEKSQGWLQKEFRDGLIWRALLVQAESWQIQTNETARGVTWLLPAALLQIEAAYLVELGASAGLNLLADLRRFDLRWAAGGELRLGLGEAPQFVIECEGPRPSLPARVRPPEIVARTGADARVVDLDLPDAETQLAACIWGDQPQRMQRLQEALELRRGLRGTPQAARMLRARLPDETDELLRAAVPVHPVAPVILFDTYVTAYFNDVDHRALVRAVEAFARPWTLRHQLSWLWVRFEPARAGEAPAPQIGWCRWWVEVWTQGQRHTVELGWGHPHCTRLALGPGLAELTRLRGPE